MFHRLRLLGFLFLTACASLPLLAAPETMPFDEIRRGMHGQGRTVFSGATLETFEVEILGTLEKIGPGRNLILARLSGGPLESTGVFAGMSGSPVFIDGKLIGAVAYAWGFSREPIAGITPIAELWTVDRGGTAPGSPRSSGWRPGALERLSSPTTLPVFFSDPTADSHRTAAALPLPLPVHWSGVGSGAVERWGGPLRSAGLHPIAGSGSGGGSAVAALKLSPGSPIGVQLIRGDLDMTATGTVTWVEGDRVFAFGHPLFGLGNVDLPMTEAHVQTILSSLQSSSRFASAGTTVGAIRQDRASGISGQLGAEASMLPVRVDWTDAEGGQHTVRFEVADDPFLSPLLLYSALGGILGGDENPALAASIQLLEGSAIRMADGSTLDLDDRFSGPDVIAIGAALPAFVLHMLQNNPWRPTAIVGVQLRYAYAPTPGTARIERVDLDRTRVRAGESVKASIRYIPYRGASRVVERTITVPVDAPAGPIELFATGATRLASRERRDAAPQIRDLEQFLQLVNRRRRQDRIYLVARIPEIGTTLAGERLPNLPPSRASVLAMESIGDRVELRNRHLFDQSIELPYVIEGEARVRLEILP